MEPEIADLLRAAGSEPPVGSAQLFAALYEELHRLAGRQLRRNGAGVTLSTTTLLHEAYLDVCGRADVTFADRARFIGYASRAMRGIVIDYARRSRAVKRGGGAFEITLDPDIELAAPAAGNLAELEELGEALDALADLEPSLAEVVDLHFFCGYGLNEIAELRGVSERTVQRAWRKARLLLRHHMLERGSTRAADRVYP